MEERAVGYLVEQILASLVATIAVPSGGYPLAGGGTVTHQAKCVSGNGNITGYVFSDVAGTLFIEQSIDSLTYDVASTIAVPAGVAVPFNVTIYGTLARARYLNGAAPQTLFRINCVTRSTIGGAPNSIGTAMAGMVIVNYVAPALGIGGVVESAIYQLNSGIVGAQYLGYDTIRGFGISDVVGVISVLQGVAVADLAAPYANAVRVDYAVPAAGNGVPIAQLLVAPFFRIIYTNGAGAQARVRFFAELQ